MTKLETFKEHEKAFNLRTDDKDEYREWIFFCAVQFYEHEKTCVECAGETEVGFVGREKYLCEAGKYMTRWWWSKPDLSV